MRRNNGDRDMCTDYFQWVFCYRGDCFPFLNILLLPGPTETAKRSG